MSQQTNVGFDKFISGMANKQPVAAAPREWDVYGDITGVEDTVPCRVRISLVKNAGTASEVRHTYIHRTEYGTQITTRDPKEFLRQARAARAMCRSQAVTFQNMVRVHGADILNPEEWEVARVGTRSGAKSAEGGDVPFGSFLPS